MEMNGIRWLPLFLVAFLALPAGCGGGSGREDGEAEGYDAPDAADQDAAGEDAAADDGADDTADDDETADEPEGGDGDDGDGPCAPDCAGRTCGPDGCGGSCGFCAPDEACAETEGRCLKTYYRIEAAQRILGPAGDIDTHYNTLRTPEGLFAYVANATTWTYFGPSLDSLERLAEPALAPGGDGSFDECGAWLNAAVVDGTRIVGWYHAEENCDYAAGITHKSVAWCESHDGGRTFVKEGYPGNRVLTADSAFDGDQGRDDAGDHAVVRTGGWSYMYFLATVDWRIHVARSPAGEGGPGTWWKYHEGDFTEPGLGGRSSPVEGIAYSWVTFDAATAMHAGLSLVSGWNITLAFSDDLIHFTPLPYPLLVVDEADWSRSAGCLELVAYPSLLGADGASDTIGETFYIYHVLLLPGEGFDRRYLVRRLVTRVTAADPDDPLGNVPRTALVRYRSDERQDDWATTVQVDGAYGEIGRLGYILTAPVGGAVPLSDCRIDIWDDHMIVPAETCTDPGVTYLRRLGWILTGPGPGRIAVYRCFDEASTNHFVSTDPACEGEATEWIFGYLLEQ